MGQLIGLAILILVVYAILSSVTGKKSKVQPAQLPDTRNDFYKQQCDRLEQSITKKELLIDQIHADYQQKIETAYMRGFQDGSKSHQQ